jgi:hypothetical protein
MNWKKLGDSIVLGTSIVLALAGSVAWAQGPASGATAACGKAKVHLSNPNYLTTTDGIVVVETPQGWGLDRARKGPPFYFFKRGEKYEDARTLMYINVERLETSLQRAVDNDVHSFHTSCGSSPVQHLSKLELLENGCESSTQLFICDRKQKPYVDLVTKISIGGLLLNVVLSSDATSEISRYKKDYEDLLKHLTLAN